MGQWVAAHVKEKDECQKPKMCGRGKRQRSSGGGGQTYSRERGQISLFSFPFYCAGDSSPNGSGGRRKKEKLCLQGLSGRSPGLEEEKGRGGGTEEEEEPLGARDHIL